MTTDFDQLPPSVNGSERVEIPSEDNQPETVTIDGPICETCGRVIIRPPGARGRKPKWHKECRPSTKASGTRRKASKSAGVNYREGLDALFSTASFGLLMAAGDHNKPLLADAKAVAEHGPNISAALDQLANEKPEVAAVLEKILAVGPYGLVLGAVAPLVAQVLSNHGTSIPGVETADEYVAVKKAA